MNEGTRENRIAPRVAVSWEVQFTRSTKEVVLARIDNISVLGAHLIAPLNLPNSEPLLIKIRPLIDGKPHSLQSVAKVVHSRVLPDNRGFGIGIVFYKASESFQGILRKLLLFN